MSVRLKLSSLYSTLPPAERKAADFILANSEEASHMIISDIAKASNVSIPSVTRLTKKLGYPSFLEFRVALAGLSADENVKNTDQITDGDSDEAFIRNLMLAQMHAFDLTFHSLSKEKLCLLADQIASAGRIVFFGSVDALTVVYAVNEAFARLGLDSTIVQESGSMRSYASKLDKGDVFFAVARGSGNAQVIDALKTAKKRGAVTVFMSNSFSSAAKQTVEHFILTSKIDLINELCGFETDSAQKALLEVIAALVAKKLGHTNKTQNAADADNKAC